MRSKIGFRTIYQKLKLLSSIILFLATSENFSGQLVIGDNTTPDKIIPSTPETYSIFKAGDFPVDYRTGKLNLTIPIYNITTQHGLSIPINLTYNTGGIKVDETSSTVGLGWTLALPNSIAVEQHGRNDLTNNSKWFPNNVYDHVYSTINLESLPPDLRTNLHSLDDGFLDMQPDIFHYNLPTVSGSFVMDSDGIFHTVPYDDVKISYSDANKKFLITDPTGIIYTLKKGNSVTSTTNLSHTVSTSSFFLESIKLPSNEEIFFKYDKMMIHHNIANTFQDVFVPAYEYTPVCNSALTNDQSSTANTSVDIMITEIRYNNETVNFHYKNIIAGVPGRKDVNSDNPQETFALDKITVNNSAGHIIANYQLNHDYFGVGNSPDYRNYRLKLTGINNLLQNNSYSFQYNETHTPALESLAQDLWGYYNGKENNLSLIPNLRYYNIYYTQGGDRKVYSDFSQAFILKKINYPTGGSSSFTYESNTIWDQLLIPDRHTIQYGTVNNAYINSQNEYESITKVTPSNEHFYINIDPLNLEELWVEFTNSCSNQIPDQIPDNGSSMGIAYLEEWINNQWKIIATFSGSNVTGELTDQQYFLNSQAPKRIRTVRRGNCSVALKVYKVKNIKSNNQNNPVGGLRIKSIDDFDGSATYTKRQFEYHRPNLPGNRSSAFFSSPLEFMKRAYKVVRFQDDDMLCEAYALAADQAINSSLTGKDVVGYEYVTEHISGRGRKQFQYRHLANALDITALGGSNAFNPYELQNKNLISETMYSLNGNTPLREITYNYNQVYFKNNLSENYSPSNPLQIIPSTAMGIYRLRLGPLQLIYHTTKILSHYPIQAGKFLLKETLIWDYVNGNAMETKTKHIYSLNSMLPINLLEKITFHPDSIISRNFFKYAHEKNNQYLIGKNMVAVPLETTVIRKKDSLDTGKVISQSLTKYPGTQSEANTKTAGLPLPYEVWSKDLQNNTTLHKELSYDLYDDKGNIQQYTSKDIPATIIWGYNDTQPIAKIEGALYDQIKTNALITAIITASNTDASEGTFNSEQALITALDNLRKSANFSGYQITTYTYDPLVGVRSITPPSGIREIYIYDAANRLKEIREESDTGKLLKEYKYNYKQ